MPNVKADEVVSAAKQEDPQQEPTPSNTMAFPLTTDQARVTAFPPGCSVLHVDNSTPRPNVTEGMVKSISFDVASKELLYRVKPTNGGNSDDEMIVAFESQLLFASLCPVEATLNNGSAESTTKPAVILSSYQPVRAKEPLYSLQEEESGALLHGLPKACIKYRPVEIASQQEQQEEEIPTHHQEEVQETVAVADAEPTEQATIAEEPKGQEELTEEPPPPPPPERKSSPTKHRCGRRSSVPGCGIKRSKSASQTSPPQSNPSAPRIVSEEKEQERKPKRARVSDYPIDTQNEDRRRDGDDNQISEDTKRSWRDTRSDSAHRDRSEDYEEEEKEEDYHETVFHIPENVFLIDHIIDFFRKNTHELMEKTGCTHRLKSRIGRDCEEFYVEVKGATRDVESAICVLEKSLLRTLHYFEKGRALYYMALLNNHRYMTERGDFKIVYQYCYHQSKDEKKIPRYMAYKRLPENSHNFLGNVLGRDERKKKKLVKETNCDIDVVGPETDSRPHYVIYGDSVDAVARCAHRLQSIVEHAEMFYRRIRSSQCRQR